jgi:hypothetical protein
MIKARKMPPRIVNALFISPPGVPVLPAPQGKTSSDQGLVNITRRTKWSKMEREIEKWKKRWKENGVSNCLEL